MLEINKNWENIEIKNSDGVVINIDILKNTFHIWEYFVDFPGEYEKSGILLEVKEFEWKLFYNFSNEGKIIVVIFDDQFELKEEITNFFWDIDILLIVGSKTSAKLVEWIEAKMIIPFGEAKDIFLNTLGQHIEAVPNLKIRGEISWDNVEYISLWE